MVTSSSSATSVIWLKHQFIILIISQKLPPKKLLSTLSNLGQTHDDPITNCRGENLISTCYLLQSIVAHFEKDTVKSGGEVGPVQT